ncbi:arsenic resistance N-acetyltransferase ArsN2 [Lysobacter sp. S4-A87]|uniref:arsenic resistance N-acetyltransferase ArsN2 n=1 Tax=Lysobacter sp. S4-A87 TaxID=2925843 RepID=UPI001F532527|nr:arsenic resistance N-acetyltransferase ArsN2 [Lysobacter sp. S4-A87]UNK49774.1 arsenic resistance N-acetyltransferase ArsN2 [Lysobacter sp. S4-A87]
MDLRRGGESDTARIRALLVDCGLPTEDLDDTPVDFLVAGEGGDTFGVVGLQSFGQVGLLRSLAVHADGRGKGAGSALVDALESHARAAGVRQLVLLTQTAEPFFAARGYAPIARAAAPAAVQGSAEFRSICPASATCMSKELQPR